MSVGERCKLVEDIEGKELISLGRGRLISSERSETTYGTALGLGLGLELRPESVKLKLHALGPRPPSFDPNALLQRYLGRFHSSWQYSLRYVSKAIRFIRLALISGVKINLVCKDSGCPIIRVRISPTNQ